VCRTAGEEGCVRVAIFGKPGCGKCDSAKKNFATMGVEFEYYNVEEITEGENWRENGAVIVSAGLAWIGNDLPLVLIDDFPYTYPGAVRFLKSLRREQPDGQGKETRPAGH
jgi:glutaredoxin